MSKGSVIKDLTANGGEAGVVQVTIAAGPASTAYATSIPCTSCLVVHKSGTGTYVNVDAAATTSHFPLSSTPIPIPVHDVTQLNFIGTANDVVCILWRR